MTDTDDSKQRQREILRLRLAAMDQGRLSAGSDAIVRTLEGVLRERPGGGVLGFHPLAGEPDIRPLLEQAIASGRTVCLPEVDWDRRTMAPARLNGLDQVREGRHGVVEPLPGEPIDIEDISVVLVPGLGFDDQGRRLGRGGGFYDRFLAACPHHVLPVGIGFREQLMERIETGPTDIPLPMIITDAGIIMPGSSTMGLS